tara:strand:- start:316 stop:570 length:255 start_codon:yes stop_codon:yes gene_type:complete
MSEIKKLDEQEFKQVTEHQDKINQLLLKIGALEAQKHAGLHEIADVNKEGEEMKKDLEKKYGAINISLKDGTFEPIEKSEEDKK